MKLAIMISAFVSIALPVACTVPASIAEKEPTPVPFEKTERGQCVFGERPIRSIVLAVDQSRSMAGFLGAGGELETITTSLQSTIKSLKHISSGTVEYRSIGRSVTAISSEEYLDPRQFKEPGADLVQALGELMSSSAAADLTVLTTDGQPSSRTPSDCRPLSVEDVDGLSQSISRLVSGCFGVWVVLERIRFDGRAFLNCARPTAEIRRALDARDLKCTNECSFSVRGPRTLMMLVVASPHAAVKAQTVVAEYLAKRPDALGLQLHPAMQATWQPEAPRVHLWRAGKTFREIPAEKADSPLDWTVKIPCHEKDLGAVFCLDAGERKSGAPASLLGLGEPRVALHPNERRSLHELEDGEVLTEATSARLEARNFDDCGEAWKRLRALTEESPQDRGGSCRVGPDSGAHEIGLACGCVKKGAHREKILLHQPHQTDAEETIRLAATFDAGGDDWFKKPESIYGLSAFLRNVAKEVNASSPSPVPVVSLTIEIQSQ